MSKSLAHGASLCKRMPDVRPVATS
jgi:hypothetical protein